MKVIPIEGIIGIEVEPKDVRAALDSANGGPVRIEISSPGGFVTPGLTIHNLIKEYKGPKEVCIMGMAASMASYIALAAGKVSAHDNAVFMIHNVKGFGIGDHRDLRASADNFEKLTNLLAKAYSKKSGKTIQKVREMMDSETYLFGDEGHIEGFIDEIINTDNGKDKAEAVAVAMESMTACIAKMKAIETGNDDMVQAAALMGNVEKTEKEDEKNKSKEEKDMTLKEYLASNPDAKAMYDAEIASAKAEGEKAGKEGIEARIKKCAAYVNGEYPAAIKALAVKAMTGEEEVAAVVGAVTVFDAQNEARRGRAAATETRNQRETAPTGSEHLSEGGAVNSEEDFQAEIARAKGGK